MYPSSRIRPSEKLSYTLLLTYGTFTPRSISTATVRNRSEVRLLKLKLPVSVMMPTYSASAIAWSIASVPASASIS